MKKIVVLLLGLLVTVTVHALSLRELWVNMPDSVLPVLNKSMRTEFVDLVDMGVKPEVKNLLEENSVLDTLTSDFLQLTSSKASTIQLKLLPCEGKDSLLCMVRTWNGPEKESEVSFYDQKWERLDASGFLAQDIIHSASSFFQAKPDTMSMEKYEGLISGLEPQFSYSFLSPKSNIITFCLSLPLVTESEKKEIQALLMQRKFKWDDKKFNEI